MSIQFLSKKAISSLLSIVPEHSAQEVAEDLVALEKYVSSNDKDQGYVDVLLAEYIIYHVPKHEQSKILKELRQSVVHCISQLQKDSIFIIPEADKDEVGYCFKQHYLYLEDALGFLINETDEVCMKDMDESIVMMLVNYINNNIKLKKKATEWLSQLLNDELDFVVSVDSVKDKQNTDILIPITVGKPLSFNVGIICVSVKDTLLSGILKVKELTVNQYVSTHKSMRLNDELLNHLNLWMNIAQNKKALISDTSVPSFC